MRSARNGEIATDLLLDAISVADSFDAWAVRMKGAKIGRDLQIMAVKVQSTGEIERRPAMLKGGLFMDRASIGGDILWDGLVCASPSESTEGNTSPYRSKAR